MKRTLLISGILTAVAGALILRLPLLSLRPMHTDEAVHAIKFGKLLEKDYYVYNPVEYHGPTLNYFTLIPAYFAGDKSLAQTNEFTLRIVPVVFGIGVVLLIFLLHDGLGLAAVITAAFLAAISPAMVFYSRYYIQEMLLVFYTLAVIVFGWRYSRSSRLIWIILLGLALGLMHATKETCIIAFGCMLLAVLVTRLFTTGDSANSRLRAMIKLWHLPVALLAAAAISVVFYSSFFSNPHGPWDSIAAYSNYFERANAHARHHHPWYYYLRMLLLFHDSPGPWWSEALIVVLAVAGFLATVCRKGLAGIDIKLARFLAFYTLFMTLIYSIIPYKTPWSMLSFLLGMIILAGIGLVAMFRWLRFTALRVLLMVLVIAAGVNLLQQSYRANYKFYTDQRNPYVYAHSTTDVLRLAGRIDDISPLSPAGHSIRIDIISSSEDYWPLPWYLRAYSQVGYWTEMPPTLDAPIIVASQAFQAPLEKLLNNDYHNEYYGLRPAIILNAYIKNDLWKAFIDRQK